MGSKTRSTAALDCDWFVAFGSRTNRCAQVGPSLFIQPLKAIMASTEPVWLRPRHERYAVLGHAGAGSYGEVEIAIDTALQTGPTLEDSQSEQSGPAGNRTVVPEVVVQSSVLPRIAWVKWGPRFFGIGASF